MTISVIIATKDRPACLTAALASIIKQTLLPDQILIIDQSTSAEGQAAVAILTQAIESRGDGRPKIVYILDRSVRGAGAARNIGIERSRSELLVFLDDDVELEPDYLQQLKAVYIQKPEVGGVSGMVTNYVRPSFRARFLEEFFCVGPFHDERLPLYWNAASLLETDPIPIKKVSGCVMSFRRTALNGLGFDSNYLGAGSEDVELSWRISQEWQIVLAPRARLAHHRTREGPSRENWLSYTIKGQYYLYHKIWKTSLKNRVCFLWLNCGFIVIAAVSSIRQRSLAPWIALLSGIRGGKMLIQESTIRFSEGSKVIRSGS